MPETVAFCNKCVDAGRRTTSFARTKQVRALARASGGNMFREPLRRDPLVVGWVLVMLLAAFVALSNNTTWSGTLQADRIAGFLKDLAEAFLWSFLLLLLLAWLRARGWRDCGGSRPQANRRSAGPVAAPQE